VDINKIRSLPLFFIIGQPRSGTTLLRTLLDAHPNVNIPLESPYILNLSFKYAGVKHRTKSNLLKFYNDLLKQRWFEYWTIDTTKLKESILSMEGDHPWEIICKTVNYHYQSCFEKKEILITGDKNPLYSYYPARLIKLFPNAKFIHMVRDPRANILSSLKVDFEMHSIKYLAFRWKYLTKKIHKVKNNLQGKFYTVRYEDLVSDPEQVMKNVTGFLGIDHAPGIFDFHKNAENIFSKYPEEEVRKNFKSLSEPINKSRADTWKKEMSKKDIRIIDHITGKYAKICNYEANKTKLNIWTMAGLIPAYILFGVSVSLRKFADILPYKMRNLLVNKDLLPAALSHKK